MSVGTMRAKVQKLLKTGMTASFASVPIHFQNVPFKQPEGAHIREVIMDGRSMQLELGSGFKTRHPGIYQIDVIVPEDTGTVALDAISKFVGKLFQAQSYVLTDGGYLRFRTASSNYMGVSLGFCRNVVSIPYWRDDVDDSQ